MRNLHSRRSRGKPRGLAELTETALRFKGFGASSMPNPRTWRKREIILSGTFSFLADEHFLHDVVYIWLVWILGLRYVDAYNRLVQLHETRPFGGIVAVCIVGYLAKEGLWRVGYHGAGCLTDSFGPMQILTKPECSFISHRWNWNCRLRCNEPARSGSVSSAA